MHNVSSDLKSIPVFIQVQRLSSLLASRQNAAVLKNK